MTNKQKNNYGNLKYFPTFIILYSKNDSTLKMLKDLNSAP